MMEGLRQYVLSVTAAAMICGVLSTLVNDGNTKTLIRFIFGLFLTLAVVRPFAGAGFAQLKEMELPLEMQYGDAAVLGEEMARTALADIIKERAEAYILDKAAQMDADIQAEVTVGSGDPPLPVAASIFGNLTSDVRSQLQLFLDEELGIPKENLQWNGER